MGKVNDLTDEFDRRLAAYEKQRVPDDEVNASITAYERVKTAKSICQALLSGSVTDEAVISLAVEIGRIKQSGQAVNSRSNGAR